jgi:hypothetical protein
MSDSPIYLWQKPSTWSDPTTLEEMDDHLQKLYKFDVGVNPRFVRFAQALMKRYPPGVPIAEGEAPWSHSVVPEAESTVVGVFSLDPPGGEIDLVIVLRDIVEEANKLGLTVLHSMSALGFLPDGTVVPVEQRGMWEGAKAHVKKGSPDKFTKAKALKSFLSVVSPALTLQGFVKVRRSDDYPDNHRWELSREDLKCEYLFSIDSHRGDVRLRGGGAVFFCPAATTLQYSLCRGEDKHRGGLRTHFIPFDCIDWKSGSSNRETQDVVSSESQCVEKGTVVAESFIPRLCTIRTIADLNAMFYPNGAEVNLTMKYRRPFLYLCIAYFAKNPNLAEIQKTWLQYAEENKEFAPEELYKLVEFIEKNPLNQ